VGCVLLALAVLRPWRVCAKMLLLHPAEWANLRNYALETYPGADSLRRYARRQNHSIPVTRMSIRESTVYFSRYEIVDMLYIHLYYWSMNHPHPVSHIMPPQPTTNLLWYKHTKKLRHESVALHVLPCVGQAGPCAPASVSGCASSTRYLRELHAAVTICFVQVPPPICGPACAAVP
jgi:hypothetical protein